MSYPQVSPGKKGLIVMLLNQAQKVGWLSVAYMSYNVKEKKIKGNTLKDERNEPKPTGSTENILKNQMQVV